MKVIEIAIPWNNHAYMSCNGFHPLYHSLFDVDANQFKFNITDEKNLLESLADNNTWGNVVKEIADAEAEFFKQYHNHVLAAKFLSYISAEDLWLTSKIPGDVELHHTSPLTMGKRPFVLHCESFLPIFMPFAYQGRGFVEDVNDVRSFYDLIFSNPNCLGIYSHIQSTLDQISTFFNNPVIDKKLVLTRIGLSERTRRKFDSVKSGIVPKAPMFLFTNSAHNNPQNFNLRGGAVALLFAENFIKNGRLGKFIFRCSRPTNDELSNFGVDINFLIEAEKNQHILWVEQYLSEDEQLNLFKEADFFLLPSINLHSVSIMQAQLSGSITVVTDTFGNESYVKDMINGLILNGVKDEVWFKSDNLGVWIDDHKKWTQALNNTLADQLYNQIVAVLDNQELYKKIIVNAQNFAKEQYSGGGFKREFLDNVRERLKAKHPKLSRKTISIPLVNPRQILESILFSPIVPRVVLETEQGIVFWRAGYYCFVPRVTPIEADFRWSVLFLRKNGFVAHLEVDLGSLHGYILPSPSKDSNGYLIKSAEAVRIFLINNPRMNKLMQPMKRYMKKWLHEWEILIFEEDKIVSSVKTLQQSILSFIPLNEKVVSSLKKTRNKIANVVKSRTYIVAIFRVLKLLIKTLLRLVLFGLKKILQRYHFWVAKLKASLIVKVRDDK